MKREMECPFCDGTAELIIERKETEFRKESFIINHFFYRCNKCNEEFTTNEVDSFTLEQLHNQYREKHKIPFPEEIVSIREKYQLPATKMAQVLGLGINSYSNFEKGEIPSISIGNLIRTAANPTIFKDYLLNAKDNFTDNSFEKCMTHLTKLIQEEGYNDDSCFELAFNEIYYKTLNSYNGYKKPNFDKIINLMTFFLSECLSDYNDKLKLVKLLFYTDFYNYQNSLRSITGMAYRAIQYGPVPSNYDCLFAILKDEKLISSKVVNAGNGKAVELFEAIDDYNLSVFNEKERETIITIANKFGKISSWDIVALSKNELTLGELNDKRELINYQEYAFHLEKL